MKRVTFLITAVFAMILFILAGQGQAIAQGADDPGQVEAGKAVFEMNCAGCHAVDGTGVAGRGRPLTGIASQGDRATHIGSITNGKGGMPAFGEQISADEIEQAASYVRLTFVEAATAETTELAVTGVGTTGLALIGVTMLAGGAQLVLWSRRDNE